MNKPEAIDDLWGAFPEPDPSPVMSLLNEQAELLKQKTKGVLSGQTSVQGRKDGFDVAFFIVAPPINNYIYLLLTVHHGPTPFPARVYEVGADGGQQVIECSDIDEFKDAVRNILQSQRVRDVVSGLLATVNASLGGSSPTVDDDDEEGAG